MSDEHDKGGARGIICHHSLTGTRPVGLVLHHLDGTWGFICDDENAHHGNADELSVICSHCAFGQFVAGLQREDVPPGHEAERPDKGSRWVVRPMTEEEIEEHQRG